MYGCDELFCLYYCWYLILDSYISENAVVPIKFRFGYHKESRGYGQTPKVIRGIFMRRCTQQKWRKSVERVCVPRFHACSAFSMCICALHLQ